MEVNVKLPVMMEGTFYARSDILPTKKGDFALVVMTDHDSKRTWLDVVELDGSETSKQLSEADETATIGRVMMGGRTAHLFTAEQWERWRNERK